MRLKQYASLHRRFQVLLQSKAMVLFMKTFAPLLTLGSKDQMENWKLYHGGGFKLSQC